jgi:hypothetical protein
VFEVSSAWLCIDSDLLTHVTPYPRYPDFLKDVSATERPRARFAVLLSLNERLGPLLALVDVSVRRQSLVRLRESLRTR